MKQYCCEAQMYLHLTSGPPARMKFCDKCKGERVPPLPLSPEDAKRLERMQQQQGEMLAREIETMLKATGRIPND